MKLKILGSSSKGNCYLLQADNGKYLMIEAGINFNEIKKAVDFRVSDILGCIVSHSHSDHSKCIKDVLKYCIPVYSSSTTKEEVGIQNDRFITVKPNTIFSIGDFSIIPFDVKHDVRCYGYLLKHNESGIILFATDCCYLPCTFGNLTNILIEANYSKEILKRNSEKGLLSEKQINRVVESHMSYKTCIDTLQANDIKAVNNIVLIHLSDGNSDAKAFQEGIKEATGKRVFIAEPGLEINFNKTPF